jgi:hypothetical protein
MLLRQHEYPARISPQKPTSTPPIFSRARTENLLHSSLGFHPTPRATRYSCQIIGCFPEHLTTLRRVCK